MIKRAPLTSIETEEQYQKMKAPKIKKQTFIVPEYARSYFPEGKGNLDPLKPKSSKTKQDEELEQLFDQVVTEIEERARYVNEI